MVWNDDIKRIHKEEGLGLSSYQTPAKNLIEIKNGIEMLKKIKKIK